MLTKILLLIKTLTNILLLIKTLIKMVLLFKTLIKILFLFKTLIKIVPLIKLEVKILLLIKLEIKTVHSKDQNLIKKLMRTNKIRKRSKSIELYVIVEISLNIFIKNLFFTFGLVILKMY